MIERILLLALFWLLAVFLPRSLWMQPWLLASVQIGISAFVVVCRVAVGGIDRSHLRLKPSRLLLMQWSSVVAIAGIVMYAQAWKRTYRIDVFDPIVMLTLGHALLWLYLSVSNQMRDMAEGRKRMALLEIARTWSQKPIGRLALSELQALRYAVAPLSRSAFEDRDQKRFWQCRDVSQMAWMFVVIAVLESIVLHIIAFQLKGFLIVGVAIMSDVFIVYSIGIARSIAVVPTEIVGDKVIIRVGILFEATILKSDIEYTPITNEGLQKRKVLNGSLLSNPNLLITLKSPKVVSVLSLFSRRVIAIKMKIERPDEFVAATRL